MPTVGVETGPRTWGNWQLAPLVRLPRPKNTADRVVLVLAIGSACAFSPEVLSTHGPFVLTSIGRYLGRRPRRPILAFASGVLTLAFLAFASFFFEVHALAFTFGGCHRQGVATPKMFRHLAAGLFQPRLSHKFPNKPRKSIVIPRLVTDLKPFVITDVVSERR